jgi:ATP-dependent helicase/nuclease subunit A
MINEINDIEASLWISASAGTGKTKSLINRILALLIGGSVNPSRILCLTYTKSAATEMLTRLSNYFHRFYFMEDDELRSELRELGISESKISVAKSLYEKSMNSSEWVQIKTIHGFCFNVLERFPLETGVLPGVKICDDYQYKELINEAINKVYADEEFHKFFYNISDYTIDIGNVIKEVFERFSNFFSKFDDFLSIYSAFFEVNTDMMSFENAELRSQLLNVIFCGNHRKIFTELAEILINGSDRDAKNANMLLRSLENCSEDFIQVFLTKESTIRSNLCTKKMSDKHAGFLEKMTETAELVLEYHEQRKRYASAKANISMFSVLKEVWCCFSELKRKNHYIDFNDVITMTITLFNNLEWVMYKIDNSIDHLLIDEAQDTSPEQWEIIKLITDEFFVNYDSVKTIFIVGDEKQSIYSFQGADVRLFKKMHRYFKERSETNGQKFYDVILNKSYRTTGNILSFIDMVFRDSFDGTKHLTNRDEFSGVVEIVELFEDDEKIEPIPWEPDSSNKLQCTSSKKLAKYVANFIRNTIDSGVFVESKNRAAIPSDFLILFQRRDMDSMKNIINALGEEKIPVSGVDRVFLRDELIIEDLIVFTEFSICPFDDLACAIVLKSPIVGITESELMNLCLNRKEEPLWSYALEDKGLCEKYSLRDLNSLIESALYLPPYDYFMKILTSGTKEKFISRLGVKCLDVLSEFLDIVMKYEQENTASLQSFLKWFDSFVHEVKKESFLNENSVRLMTVHASKGLQSPFVIIADSDFIRTKNDKILVSDDDILLWDFFSKMRAKQTELLAKVHSALDLEESKRLLYVALTRAEDFICVLGEKGGKNNENCWYNFINKNLQREKFKADITYGHNLLRYGN